MGDADRVGAADPELMSIFTETNHMFLRSPGGEVENAQAMKQAGFGAIFCNVGDHEPDEWDLVRQNARSAGVVCGPWLRTGQQEFEPEKLLHLIDVADEWGTPAICNSEKDIDNTGDDVTPWMAQQIGNRDFAISSEPNPYDAVDWKPLTKYPALPQHFPAEQGSGWTEEAIINEWLAKGFKCVVLTYGSYGGMTSTQFKRLEPYGVYTGNDCGGNFMPWAPIGERVPCAQNGGDMGNEIPPVSATDIIGSEHGITAFVDWLQKQPGMPVRDANYNPKKPGTWPWPERLERALKILAAAHDKDV